jgi:hypothetical protein
MPFGDMADVFEPEEPEFIPRVVEEPEPEDMPETEEVDLDVDESSRILQNGTTIDTYVVDLHNAPLMTIEEELLEIGQRLQDQYGSNPNFPIHFKINYRYQGLNRTESTKYVVNRSDNFDNLVTLINDLLSKYDDVEMVSIVFEVLNIDANVIQGQGSKYHKSCVNFPESGCAERVDEDHIVYNPLSKDNCLFHSVVCCIAPELIGRSRVLKTDGKKRDPIALRAAKLKQSSKCINKISISEDVKRLSDYLKTNIVVMDKTLKTLESFYNENYKKTIRLINSNNHFYSYIDFSEEVKLGQTKKKSDNITKGQTESERNTNFYAADIETFNDSDNNAIPYAIGIANYDSKGKLVYKQWVGHENCINDFFEYIFKDKKNKYIYFHNGGKFDVNVMMPYISKSKYTIDNRSKIYLNGRFAKIVVCFEKTKITFLDSICLLSKSLEECTGKKGFDVEHKKLVGSIDHNQITIDNYKYVMENGQFNSSNACQIIKTGDNYLFNDVVGLLEVLDKFGESIFEEYGINITSVISSSSISKRIFKTKYLSDDYPIKMLELDVENFIKKTYHGGRTEGFFKGLVTSMNKDELFNLCIKDYKKIFNNDLTRDKFEEIVKEVRIIEGIVYYYDFTSLYPSAAGMGDCDLPYGSPHTISVKNCRPFKEGKLIEGTECLKFLKEKAVFMECLVKTIDFKKKPIHCITTEKTKKLIFPRFNDWTRVYHNKQVATQANETCKAQIYKIIANSGYGYWALKTDARTDVDVIESTDLKQFLYRILDGADDIYEMGDKICINYKKCLTDVERNIAIGSYITSLSRLKIWSLINDIDKKGDIVLYMDTDSVFTTCKIEDHSDLMEKYMWDGCGDELGSLKNEIKDAIKKDSKKNGLKDDEIKEVMSKCDGRIQLFVAGGLKSYSYLSTYDRLGVTGEITDSKLKGYKQQGSDFTPKESNIRKLKLWDYLVILSGGSLEQEVSQFTSQKSSNKQAWQKITKVKKNFRFDYKKGKINGKDKECWGFIDPYCLPRDNDKLLNIDIDSDNEKN